MNKLINNLFEKDMVIKVVSVLTAILIWFLVLDTDNPFEERTLAIPLTSNIEVLQARNLQIVGTQLPMSIDIKIKGRRQKIMGVTANDFKVSIDLSGITEPGMQRISIDAPKYLGDQDVLISGTNPSSVNLNIERRIGKPFPVSVEFQGKLPAGYELINVKANDVVLEEKESSISKVNKVVARVNYSEIKDNKEIVTTAVVLNSEGQALRQFEGTVPVIVTFDLAKRVPVTVATKGEPATDVYLKEIRYSQDYVRVLGSMNILDTITKFTAETIDIAGQSASFITPLVISAPKGATLYKEDADNLTAEIVLERLAIRSINMPTNLISIYESDLSGNKVYRVLEEFIPITIKGRPEEVNAVRSTDIKLSIQVNGFEIGEHEVPLKVQLPGNISLVGEYIVKLIIEEAPKDPTTPTPVTNNP